MQESFLSGEDLDERTKFKDAYHLAVVNLSHLRNGADSLDPVKGLLHSFLIVAGNVNNTLGASAGKRFLRDGDDGTGLLLDLLDGLSALSDDCSDELGSNADLLDARNERLVVLARLADGLHHLAHNVDASPAGLLQSLLQNVVGKSVNLDVHLGCGDSVLCSGNLEVHISQVILVSKDVGEDGVAVVRPFCVCDKSHCHTCHRLGDLYACVHKGKAATAYGSH